ncbi:glycine cleavage system protein R [Planctobacterium marinum]|uniref:Glycine cleavage system transcriptional repressor n=1 Tax=Planctobacterium marinum TaxID=1631968 RepID=A0AA48HVL3_9ALTE|nr:hypothetical protein MACH26_21940 [Planctobacterium marinum]
MKHQLIVTFLGADKAGILGEIASLACSLNCNILDSRLAHYGQDFSFNMILEGSLPAITKAELNLPSLAHKLDLLCMVKRTKHHTKQHLVHLADVEFNGCDAVGIIKDMATLFTHHGIHINAFRQKTVEVTPEEVRVECKMVVSMPQELSIETIEPLYNDFIEQHNLQGSFKEKH